MHRLFFFPLLLFLGWPLGAQDDGFRPIFNGKDLTGWESYGGKAPFRVEDDAIVGEAVINTPNTFLCTTRPYGDFILELDFYNEAPLNSGVMARGQWRQEGEQRVIFGYQVEIDPEPRAYTGGIYDERRRGWIYPLHYNEPARHAFRHGAWNQLRIECLGQEIRTFINGIPAANLIDDLDASGMICLQVHSIPKALEGKEMRWKNLRVKEKPSAADRLPSGDRIPVVNLVPNFLSASEIRQGWRLLWDGKSSQGWRGVKRDDFPTKGWEMADGELRVLAGNGGESTNGGDIITLDHFSDFELQFEFKPSVGANSGVKYFVDPTLNKGAGSAIGLEFQILDDKVHPDAKMGVAGNRTAGSLYDLITAKVLDTPRNKDLFIGDWNRGRIVVRGGKVEHWLNGFKVVEYDRFSQMFGALVNYSKYKDWENFGRWPAGPILLQDHGDAVAFRSIKIREL
ncbi:DUF1080 domain-containing protein [Neolewinella lacunae]|uniref:DUF1080 domain-containing protein n=1 Tax=Neolewinella lacunae TaxID=1517758 RepID=A0A923T957_9BACT|nr:DUF1080 domain-containing protein [Neolewinella lacunae]MBC6995231.1 DUF1080 domain-containing protein [Neolewinella lacunae]MDN3635460.1 DUF1080 domain-containing protein [Neolewinella lacunae]